jgi:hypothetical protein
VRLAGAIGDRTHLKTDVQFTFFRLNIRDKSDVAVVDLLVIVVLDLQDLVAGRKGPAQSLDLALARRIQCGLEFDVEGARSDAAAVHWGGPGHHGLDRDQGGAGCGFTAVSFVDAQSL